MSAVTRLFKWFRDSDPEPVPLSDSVFRDLEVMEGDWPAPVITHTHCVDRQKLIEAIDRFVNSADISPIWTRNERRVARSIALYLQQQLNLPITYGP